MLLKFLKGKYLLTAPIEECFSLVQKALNEVGLKNVTIRKEVFPNYLLVQYSPGWVGKNLEIEFFLKQRENGTEVSVKWPYAEKVPPPKDVNHLAVYREFEEERKQKMERLVEGFRTRIRATDISSTDDGQ